MNHKEAGSFRSLILTGAFWTTLSFGFAQVVRLGGNVILTRLLSPDMFGLMALTSVVVAGVTMFADVGIYPSIVRSKRGEDAVFLRTAWTVQTMRGVAIWLVASAAGIPMARYYKAPELAYLIPVVGFSAILQGLRSTNHALLDRRMMARQRETIGLVAQVAGAIAMIVWAWFSPNVWALVSGGLVLAAIETAWGHRLGIGPGPRFMLDKDSLTELFTFGKWITLSTAITFFSNQVDRLVLGRLISLHELGVLGVAFGLIDAPSALILRLSRSVLFPVMSRMTEMPRAEFLQRVLKARRAPMILVSVGLAGVVALGDIPVRWIYDDRYVHAGWTFVLLATTLWFRASISMVDPMLLAIGNTFYGMAANAARLPTNFILIPVMFAWLGMPGAVLAMVSRELVYYVVMNIGLAREKLKILHQDWWLFLLFVAVTLAFALLRYALGFGTALDLMQMRLSD
jgi:O-antigen/teichoic acid export membrane protein